MNITARIKQKAIALGFDLVGITTADPLADTQIAHFKSWLTNGSAGQMDYMKRNLEKRTNPARLLKGAKSIICVALNYKPPASTQTEIANFALYEDYHLFIKKRLFELADFINAKTDHPARFKACVDSGPIAERPIAQRAGLGFIGTNHMLINPELGLQILLGELVTDLQLTPDEPAENLCHNCDKCIKACPTAALASDGTFNANKCISYLTIEHKGKIPAQLAAEIGSHLFGCDECIKACPFDKPAPPCRNKDFARLPQVDLRQISGYSQTDFDKHFANSTIYRLGLERLKRNAKICIANQGTRNVSISPEGTSTP